jgi:hypothetical protein
VVGGREVLNLATSDFLGLGDDENVRVSKKKLQLPKTFYSSTVPKGTFAVL